MECSTKNKTTENRELSSTKRIAKNTLMLYFRYILIMLVNLYTVRGVLNTLGAEDYGIYNVIAGVVNMFGFLSGAMASASQRFFSFELGINNTERLKKIFNVTLLIYIGLALFSIIVAESLGLWFVYRKLVIPTERFEAVKWIYQFSILSFATTMLTTPYMSAIIAHECLNIYAYVSIIEVLLKLGIVFILKVIPMDKLIIYGILMFSVIFLNTAIYRIICKKKFIECRFSFIWDWKMIKEIIGFTSWTIFGAFTSMARTQAITVLINQFFFPMVVAARAISTQVTNALNAFATNFNTSIYAPIVKEYAAGKKDKMFLLIFNGCKITFFLMWIFALPLFLRMEYVLTLWLKDLPKYVVVFTQLSIIEVLINSISLPIATAARAPGKMKTYELTLGTLQILMFVVSFIWLKWFNGTPVSVFVIAIILNTLMFVIRLIIVKNLIGVSLFQFAKKVFVPVLFIVVISAMPAVLLNKILAQNFIGLCGLISATSILSSCLMALIGLDIEMKKKVLEKMRFYNVKKN